MTAQDELLQKSNNCKHYQYNRYLADGTVYEDGTKDFVVVCANCGKWLRTVIRA